MSDVERKAERYEGLLGDALDAAEIAPPDETPLAVGARELEEMARSYLEDGRHFRTEGEPADALAAFAYGHAWLDAGARLGLFEVPTEDHLFTV